MNKRFSFKSSSDFNYSECLRFLQRSKLECLFFIKNKWVYFPLEVNDELFVIRFIGRKERIEVEVLQGKLNTQSKKAIKSYIAEWLDIRRDLTAFNKLCKKDHLLQPIGKSFKGLRLIGIPNLIEAISWAIIGQQINLTFAYTLKRRLIENYGEKVRVGDMDFFLFPKAKTIAKLTEDDLRPHQFSRSKIKYLTGIARAIADGEFSKTTLNDLSYEEAKACLIKYKGIGNWTADYVLMKCLRFSNAFPISDVGLHNAIKAQLNLDQKPSIEEIEKMSTEWKGWESYATFYLWHSLLV